MTQETVASVNARRMEKTLILALASKNDWVIAFAKLHLWEHYLDFVADSGGAERVPKELEKAFGVM